MSKIWMRVGLVAFAATAFVSRSNGQEATFNLTAMGGSAVSPDNSTLVVSLTSKAELVYFDTLAGKETKRVTVEFQPTQMVWGDKVIFVRRKDRALFTSSPAAARSWPRGTSTLR